MREAIVTADTVEHAKETACKQLGVESYEAEFEILEMPTRKTFGLFGGSPAKVRVYIEDDPASVAADYLKSIMLGMGVSDVEVEIRKQEGGALLYVTGSNVGFAIGHRGETLDALQYLAGLVANHVGGSYFRITIDIGGYREKRYATLESLGKKMAEKSLRTGRNIPLEPMNPYERRIIHTAVQTVEGVKSWSEGEDMLRHIVIGPENGERPVHRDSARRDFSGQRRPPFRNSSQKSSPEPQQPRYERKGPLYGKIGTSK